MPNSTLGNSTSIKELSLTANLAGSFRDTDLFSIC